MEVTLDDCDAHTGIDERRCRNDYTIVAFDKLPQRNTSDGQSVAENRMRQKKSRPKLEMDPSWILRNCMLQNRDRLVAEPSLSDEVCEAVSADKEGRQLRDLPEDEVGDDAQRTAFVEAPFPNEDEAAEEGRNTERKEDQICCYVDPGEGEDHAVVVLEHLSKMLDDLLLVQCRHKCCNKRKNKGHKKQADILSKMSGILRRIAAVCDLLVRKRRVQSLASPRPWRGAGVPNVVILCVFFIDHF